MKKEMSNFADFVTQKATIIPQCERIMKSLRREKLRGTMSASRNSRVAQVSARYGALLSGIHKEGKYFFQEFT